jgi:ribosomal protein S19E (S16A)
MTRRVVDALKSAGAVLKRRKKHLVYELPTGQNVVVSSTPSDVRAENNALREIRKASGEARPATATVGERRERKHKPGRAREPWTVKAPTMAAKLREAGVVERAQTTRIDELGRDLVSMANELAIALNIASDAFAESARTSDELSRLKRTRWHRLGRWLGLVE